MSLALTGMPTTGTTWNDIATTSTVTMHGDTYSTTVSFLLFSVDAPYRVTTQQVVHCAQVTVRDFCKDCRPRILVCHFSFVKLLPLLPDARRFCLLFASLGFLEFRVHYVSLNKCYS